MNKINNFSLAIALFPLCFTAQSAQAEIKWSGFLTASADISSAELVPYGIEPLYAEKIERNFSFDKDSVLGIQLKKTIDERYSLTGRLVAQGDHDWEVKATRAFLKYNPDTKWLWKLGRVPIRPLIYSNKVNQTHYYPWLGLPEVVYSVIPFHYLDAFAGGAHFKVWKRELGFRFAYGGLSEHLNTPVSDIQIKYKLKQFFHIKASYGDEILKFHASYNTGRMTWSQNPNYTALNNYINNTLIPARLFNGDQVNFLSVDNDHIKYQSLGYTFDWKGVKSTTEYLRRRSTAALIPNLNAWYAMIGYQYRDVLPYLTYARQRLSDKQTRQFTAGANAQTVAASPMGTGETLDVMIQNIVEGKDGPAAGDQTVVGFGLRWDTTKQVSIKFSYEHVKPDNNSSGLFNINPLKSVNIYRLGLDAEYEG